MNRVARGAAFGMVAAAVISGCSCGAPECTSACPDVAGEWTVTRSAFSLSSDCYWWSPSSTTYMSMTQTPPRGSKVVVDLWGFSFDGTLYQDQSLVARAERGGQYGSYSYREVHGLSGRFSADATSLQGSWSVTITESGNLKTDTCMGSASYEARRVSP